jgi:hypothetical protein
VLVRPSVLRGVCVLFVCCAARPRCVLVELRGARALLLLYLTCATCSISPVVSIKNAMPNRTPRPRAGGAAGPCRP